MLTVDCIAASLPIPLIGAGQSTILYNAIPKDMQGRVFAVRNAVQYCTIPIVLLGGFLADYAMEPFVKSQHELAFILEKFVGENNGSGMAVMFICTGILGLVTSILWHKNKDIR